MTSSGAVVFHRAVDHNRSFTGNCGGNSVGSIDLFCFDSVVTVVGGALNSSGCLRNCLAGVQDSTSGTPVVHDHLVHLQRASVQCPPSSLGSVTVQCVNGVASIFAGDCGSMNCAPGRTTSNGASIEHGMINNGQVDGPVMCPLKEGYIGHSMLTCHQGVASVPRARLGIFSDPLRGSGLTNLTLSQSETADSAAAAMEDDAFILCGCCAPVYVAADPPEIGIIQGIMVIYAAVMIGVGMLCALVSGWAIRRSALFREGTKATSLRRPSSSPVDPFRGTKQERMAAIEDVKKFSRSLTASFDVQPIEDKSLNHSGSIPSLLDTSGSPAISGSPGRSGFRDARSPTRSSLTISFGDLPSQLSLPPVPVVQSNDVVPINAPQEGAT